MLRYNFKRVLNARGIEKHYAFLTSNGFTHNIAQRAINNDIDRFPIGHIEKMCILLNCTPNDLMEWTPAPSDKSTNHPLSELKRDKKNVKSINHLIRELPLSKLEEIRKIIEGG